MPLPGKGLLRRVLPAPMPKHTEERLKLAANCLQAIALALFGKGLMVPRFIAPFVVSIAHRTASTAIMGVSEVLAFYLLGFIPTSTTS